MTAGSEMYEREFFAKSWSSASADPSTSIRDDGSAVSSLL